MRVIVIGGLGNFGTRICKRLAVENGLEVIATGRHVPGDRHIFDTGQTVLCARLDIDSSHFQADLGALNPQLVIHCAGPYQGQNYRVALAACSLGAHYLDLADGRDFVAGFAAHVNAAAEAAGVLAVSGASSLPGLSSAVVDHLTKRFSRLDAIRIGIAPGQQAPRGVATIKAVFGYAGKPFARWNHGRWNTVHGWQDIRTLGFNTLGNRWGAACDVPDLALFPLRYAGVRDVEFHAALELRIQHLGLWLAAGLHRLGVPLPISRHAHTLEKISKTFLDPFGSDVGGMVVRLEGLDLGGQPAHLAWHLFAGGGHGPEIPCMATVLLACKLANGALAQTGAVPCVGLLKLEEFAAEFHRWGFTWALL